MQKRFKERQYEATRAEEEFENLLITDGFDILGYREFAGFTEYLISKNDIKFEWRVWREPNVNGKNVYKMFKDCYELRTQIDNTKG